MAERAQQRGFALPRVVAPWAEGPLSARVALGWLVGLAVFSTALRVALGAVVHGPFVFLDELGYQRMAWSLAHTGHLALFGRSGLSYSPLYSVVLAPLYALVHTAAAGYAWTKVLNAFLMSAAIFPIYAIARTVLPRRSSLGVAALSLVAPLMYYSSLGLSENLAYPLFLVAVWAMLRAVREPSARNDVLLLGAMVLAAASRLQQVALVPAAATAIVIVALVAPPEGVPRLRALGRALARHWLLLGTVAIVAVAVLARTLVDNGQLPFAGRYAGVANAHASALRVLEEAVQHLAGLDLAVGVLPFAGALVAAWALARYGFPRDALVFASVAVGATVWLVLEVALDAAGYDSTSRNPRAAGKGLPPDLPRIHERYLIYLVPLFLVALVAALRVPRSKVGLRAYGVVGLATALLPALIPYSRYINSTVVADSFGLEIFARGVHEKAVPLRHAALLAVVLAGLMALVYLYAVVRGRSIAVAVLVAVLVVMSGLVGVRVRGAAAISTSKGLPAHRDWVDRVVGDAAVALVGGRRSDGNALRQTAFNNFSVRRVYYTCAMAFGPDFGEEEVTADVAGRLRDATGVLRARYAVVPALFDVRGRVLARGRRGRIVLVAPAGGVLRVPAANRSLVNCSA